MKSGFIAHRARLILHTCRFGPHSKGDDTRSSEELEGMRRDRDPLSIQGARLTPEKRTAVEVEVDTDVARAYEQALGDPFPTLILNS